MIEYVPAISLLVSFVLIILVVLIKLNSEQILGLFENKNIIILMSASLFGLLLVVHLFNEQSWIADLLKVVAGVLAGSVAATASVSKSTSVDQNAIGSEIQQAGRDINNIKEMVGDLKTVTDSVVNQFQTINENVQEISKAAQDEIVVQHMLFHHEIPIKEEYESFMEKYDDTTMPPLDDSIEIREWFSKRLEWLLSIPEAKQTLYKEIQRINESGWVVKEIQFETSPHMANVTLNCEQRLSLSNLLGKVAYHPTNKVRLCEERTTI